jgi:arylsulfatase A-like enzyme
VEDPLHAHDLHATLLKLLGIDHESLTWKHQGLERRLTDVFGDHDIADRLTARR